VGDISFDIGRKAKMRVGHELFDDPAWQLQPMRDLKSTAAEQLGTVGGTDRRCGWRTRIFERDEFFSI
jgi:hypothetical protein